MQLHTLRVPDISGVGKFFEIEKKRYFETHARSNNTRLVENGPNTLSISI